MLGFRKYLDAMRTTVSPVSPPPPLARPGFPPANVASTKSFPYADRWAIEPGFQSLPYTESVRVFKATPNLSAPAWHGGSLQLPGIDTVTSIALYTNMLVAAGNKRAAERCYYKGQLCAIALQFDGPAMSTFSVASTRVIAYANALGFAAQVTAEKARTISFPALPLWSDLAPDAKWICCACSSTSFGGECMTCARSVRDHIATGWVITESPSGLVSTPKFGDKAKKSGKPRRARKSKQTSDAKIEKKVEKDVKAVLSNKRGVDVKPSKRVAKGQRRPVREFNSYRNALAKVGKKMPAAMPASKGGRKRYIESVLMSVQAPKEAPPARIFSGEGRKTAAMPPYTSFSYPFSLANPLADGVVQLVPATETFAMFPRSTKISAVIYFPNNPASGSTPETPAAAIYQSFFLVDDQNPPIATLNFVDDGDNVWDLNLAYSLYTTSGPAYHGNILPVFTCGGSQMGLWPMTAGDQITLSYDLPVGTTSLWTLEMFAYVNGKILPVGIAQVIPVGTGTLEVKIPFEDGSFSFPFAYVGLKVRRTLTADDPSVSLAISNVYLYAGNNGGVYGFQPTNSIASWGTTTADARLIGQSFLFTNTTADLTLNGSIVMAQLPLGSDWVETLYPAQVGAYPAPSALNGYGALASLEQSFKLDARRGSYMYRKPVKTPAGDLFNWDGGYETQNGYFQEFSVNLDTFGPYMIWIMQGDPPAQQGTCIVAQSIEFLTTDTTREQKMPEGQGSAVTTLLLEDAIEPLKQFMENELHFEDIVKNVGNAVSWLGQNQAALDGLAGMFL